MKNLFPKSCVVYLYSASSLAARESMSHQLRGAVNLCRKNGWAIEAIYKDQSAHGSCFDRHGLKKLIRYIVRHPQVEMIVTTSFSKITRSPRESTNFRIWADVHGIEICTLDSPAPNTLCVHPTAVA